MYMYMYIEHDDCVTLDMYINVHVHECTDLHVMLSTCIKPSMYMYMYMYMYIH